MLNYGFNKKESLFYRAGERAGCFISMSLFASILYFIISKLSRIEFGFDNVKIIIFAIFLVYAVLLLIKQMKKGFKK